METRLDTNLGSPNSAPAGSEFEPNFLLVRDTSGDWPRWKRAAVGSAIFHLVAITALFLIKSGPYEPPPPENLRVPYVMHLYVPKELTQKAPNKGPVAKLLLSQPATPSPKLSEPAPKVTKPQVAPPPTPAPTPAPPPPPPVAQPAPTQGQTASIQPPASTPPPAPVAKPDAPKIIVEDSMQAHPAPKPGANLTPPSNSIQEAMRSLSNNGAAPSTHVESSDMSVGAGLHLPASAARLSNFELKSDPMGVDFKPYLQQVLAEVKLNWQAVFPTAARLGTRGQVTLEFSILKDGAVQKIVFAGQSGSMALDNASVAAISASNPLPSLPKDFKGDRIVLEMTFMYNMPK
jgi:TonB family protein